MLSNKKSPSSETIALAKQNIQEFANYPPLQQGHQFRTYELYLGDQVNTPAYVNVDGEVVLLEIPESPSAAIQEIVDGECVYVEIEGIDTFDRWGECERPQFGINAIAANTVSALEQGV
jgi:hypothetical protein